LILPFLVGCGSGIQQAIGAAAESGSRTFLDILLSDTLANLPDLFSFDGNGGNSADNGSSDNTGGNTDGNGDDTGGGTDTGGSDTGGGTDLVGVAADGETLFTTDCAACHCGGTADCGGGGGIDLSGAGYDRIDEKLRGGGFHGGGAFPDFADQDIADLAAFLGQ